MPKTFTMRVGKVFPPQAGGVRAAVAILVPTDDVDADTVDGFCPARDFPMLLNPTVAKALGIDVKDAVFEVAIRRIS